jgi:hypothetical protein
MGALKKGLKKVGSFHKKAAGGSFMKAAVKKLK